MRVAVEGDVRGNYGKVVAEVRRNEGVEVKEVRGVE